MHTKSRYFLTPCWRRAFAGIEGERMVAELRPYEIHFTQEGMKWLFFIKNPSGGGFASASKESFSKILHMLQSCLPEGSMYHLFINGKDRGMVAKHTTVIIPTVNN